MHKFTHAISVGGFVQALKDNGDIFVLGTRPSDEFGMKMIDTTIDLMGKTREGIVDNLKKNSEPELVEKVNTLSFYQAQVDNYEKYVNPDRYNKKEDKAKKERGQEDLSLNL
jgi:hypothetical protein